jgi:hypothetical protein
MSTLARAQPGDSPATKSTVAQLHEQVAFTAVEADPDDPIGAEAATPVAEQADDTHRESEGVVRVYRDQKVVARAFVLAEVHTSSLAGQRR